MNSPIKLLTGLGCLSLALTLSAQAQTLAYGTTAPTPGAADIYNFTSGVGDAGNVDAGNDAGTYLAMDRGAIGQTFTTGSNAAGYLLNGVWLEHVNYVNTWWNVTQSGVQLTYRLTNPGAAGTGGFVLDSATYSVTGTEPNNLGTGNAATGTGDWVYFGFATPVNLAANTVYGFDVGTVATSPNYFFETAGDNTSVYSGGDAYTTVTGGNVMTTYSGGDHVFDASLTAVVPEPTTLALAGLSGVAVLIRRRLAR